MTGKELYIMWEDRNDAEDRWCERLSGSDRQRWKDLAKQVRPRANVTEFMEIVISQMKDEDKLGRIIGKALRRAAEVAPAGSPWHTGGAAAVARAIADDLEEKGIQ